MRKLRYIGLGILILATAGIGFYYFVVYDPDAPRSDWPILQAAAPATDTARQIVGQNVHVSAPLADFKYWECVIAADPEDAGRLFTAAMHWRKTDVDIAGFYSRDGGATWQLGCERVAQPGERHADPTVAFGPDGAVFLAHMRLDPNKHEPLGTEGSGGDLRFLASPDGGKTWEERAVVGKYVDRPWIAVDTTTGLQRGSAYCIGNVDEPIIYRSADGFTTLAPPLTPLAGRKLVNCRPANPAVLADGTVLLVYEDNDTNLEKAQYRPRFLTLRSTDGGRTLTESAPVNTKWWHDTIRSSANSIGVEFPQLAADPGSRQFADRVYCVWMDGNNHEGMRIFFCASPDRGATWAQSVVISEQPMQGGAEGEYITFMPSIAVNKDGAVAVSWYDRRGLPKSKEVPTVVEIAGRKVSAFNLEANGWNVRLRASLDGGQTWLPSVQVNEESGRGEIDVGHTAGLAAGADGRFHAAWIDNRTGTNQLWTAAIDVIDK